MEISICSYSFHRTLAAGQQDIFQYIQACHSLGVTQLEPWIAHLGTGRQSTPQLGNGSSPENLWTTLRSLMKQPPPVLAPGQEPSSIEDGDYLDRVNAAAAAVGMPFGGIAVDGAHIYEPTAEARQANRALAYQWLDVAAKIGAKQMRVDAGGPEDMPDDIFKIIVEGYQDLVSRGRDKGIEIIIENHWGSSKIPENVVKIVEAVEGLGMLFDTNNWPPEVQDKAWLMCAKYAKATHIKTFEFDPAGNDPTTDLARAIHLLVDAGYNGCWGIESCPNDGNEYDGAKKTIELIQRVLG